MPVQADLAAEDGTASPATPIPVTRALLPWPDRDSDPWRVRHPAAAWLAAPGGAR
jgi:hypothetical protein